jgi:hypothetical protein
VAPFWLNKEMAKSAELDRFFANDPACQAMAAANNSS